MEGFIMADISLTQLNPIPYGNNAGRPANPIVGQPYFNGEAGRLELYASQGWQNIVQEAPSIVSVIGVYKESFESNTISLNGTGFAAGAVVSVIGTNDVEIFGTAVSVSSAASISFTLTGLTSANEPYDIKVTNPSNLSGIYLDVLYVDQTPIWSNPASGSLGTYTELSAVNIPVTVTDPESVALSYSISSGSLPGGLSINSSTGVISGTIGNITSNTTFNFTVRATDGQNVADRSFSILVNDRPPAWSTSAGSLGTYTKNSAFSATVAGTDDSGIVSYSLVSGSLPGGLSINSSTGVISGTPSVSSPLTYSFTLRVTDDGGNTADRLFTLTNTGPTWVTATTLPSFTRNSGYSTTLSATDDGTVTYSIVSGALPTGLSLNSSTGVISGTPTSSTNFTFTVRATDDSGNTADRGFNMSNVSPVWSTSGTLTNGYVNGPYSFQLSAPDDSGVAPTYTLNSGSLPAGLSLSSSGLISGTATTSATSTFTVRATDANGGFTNSGTLTIVVGMGLFSTAYSTYSDRHIATSNTIGLSSSYATDGIGEYVTDSSNNRWYILANWGYSAGGSNPVTRWGGVKWKDASVGAHVTSRVSQQNATSSLSSQVTPGQFYRDAISFDNASGPGFSNWYTDTKSHQAYPALNTAITNTYFGSATKFDGVGNPNDAGGAVWFEPPSGTIEVMLDFSNSHSNGPCSIAVVNKNTGSIVGNPIFYGRPGTPVNVAANALNDLNARTVVYRHQPGYVYFNTDHEGTIAGSHYYLYR
jgi:hypothetical protein